VNFDGPDSSFSAGESHRFGGGGEAATSAEAGEHTGGVAGGVTSGSICGLGWRRTKLKDDSFFFGLLMVRERQKRFIVGMVA